MSNPFFNALGGSKSQQSNNRNLAPALLRHIQGFRGNPIQDLQDKLNSGEMTQEQYNQLHSVAETIAQRMMSVLPRR